MAYPVTSAITHPTTTVPQPKAGTGILSLIGSLFTASQTPQVSAAKGITLAEVRQHATADDAWTILDGNVYNVTKFAQMHPGGAKCFEPCFGTDGTEHFRSFHKRRQIYVLKSPEYLVGSFSKN